MGGVKPLKRFGQHFLRDEKIAAKIVRGFIEATQRLNPKSLNVLEIGPGEGALTKYLATIPNIDLVLVEIDDRMIDQLSERFVPMTSNILHADILELDLGNVFEGKPFSIIGNFPYNISSQIVFKIIEYRSYILNVHGMFQDEVANRLCASEGNKEYGITSVLLQAYFDVAKQFSIGNKVFSNPPKVQSAVVQMVRNNIDKLDCDEALFKSVVKAAFNKRRKILSNALDAFNISEMKIPDDLLKMRAEQLSIADFVKLTKTIELAR